MTKTFKVSWIIFYTRLATIIEYRTNFILRIVAGFLSLLFLIAVWQGLRPDEFQTTFWMFYVLAGIIGPLNGEGFYRHIANEINSGQLSFYLVTPFPYLIRIIARLMADVLVSTGIGIVVIIIISFFIQGLITVSFPVILLAIPFIILGRIIGILLNFLAGCVAFKWINPDAFYLLLDTFLFFLMGSFVPFWIFPIWLQKIFILIPFRSVIATPIEIIMGRTENMVVYLTSGIIWAVILSYFSYKIWKKVLVYYEAVGG